MVPNWPPNSSLPHPSTLPSSPTISKKTKKRDEVSSCFLLHPTHEDKQPSAKRAIWGLSKEARHLKKGGIVPRFLAKQVEHMVTGGSGT